MFRRTLTCLLAFGLLASAVFAEDLAETRKKAEQGDANAQSNLGVMYDNGTGAPKDLVQAHMWWNIAGAKGNEGAKDFLALVQQEMTSEQYTNAMKLARELFAKLPKKK
jgi:TPR repeat protein